MKVIYCRFLSFYSIIISVFKIIKRGVNVKLSGTLINYYFHCKRQCWLFGNRVNLEDNSEDVKIGKALHQIKSEGSGNREISIENVKIDKITDEYVVEIKKSDSDKIAAKWQLLLYLYTLSKKGLIRKGKLEYLEKKYGKNSVEYIELTEESINELKSLENNIFELINGDIPEEKYSKKCTKCAYQEYCLI